MKHLLIFILLLFQIQLITGQDSIPTEKEHDHKNHMGLAIGVVPFLYEKEVAPGFHFHYTRVIGKFGIGVGSEAILDEHKHYGFSAVFMYSPFEDFTIGISPGILLAANEALFSTHFEAGYDFDVGEFHIGPMAEFAYAFEDTHFMFGVHFGVGF